MATIIVAVDEDGVIGNKGQIPWAVARDRRMFRMMTHKGVVIMGRKTWEATPPLYGRTSVVVTRSPKEMREKHPVKDSNEPNCEMYFTDDLEKVAKSLAFAEPFIYIIGGAEIYKMAIDLNLVENIIMSVIPGKHEGDTNFPLEFTPEWKVLHESNMGTFRLIFYTKVRLN